MNLEARYKLLNSTNPTYKPTKLGWKVEPSPKPIGSMHLPISNLKYPVKIVFFYLICKIKSFFQTFCQKLGSMELWSE